MKADSESSTATDEPPVIAHLRLKAALLMVLMLALVGGTALYVMYARGVFERTQELILISDDSEGVRPGMDMTFSGFPIGRVRKVELAEKGQVRINVDVPLKDARWLRSTSVFTLESGLVGGSRLRAFSGIPDDPPLENGAVRHVLRGDASAEIPRLVASLRELSHNLVQMTGNVNTELPQLLVAVRELGDNLTRLTGKRSNLDNTLRHVETLTADARGEQGMMAPLLGKEQARRVAAAIERTHALLVRLDALSGNADSALFQPGGALPEAQQALRQLNVLLRETQAIVANAKTASTDLDVLRAEVESSLRRVDALVNKVNGLLPGGGDREITLP
jgi:phospholipid/cholesterol/gamma-HCH transport system substrate-binding protein